jgi:hypothetical protein
MSSINFRPPHKSVKKPYAIVCILPTPSSTVSTRNDMVSIKLVALFFFAFVVAAMMVQPSEARSQSLLKLDFTDQHGRQAPYPSPEVVVLPDKHNTPSLQVQPTNCLTPLMGMMPCVDYLTNLTVFTPPGACCDGLKSIINDAPICLCHSLNGDLNTFISKPINPIRMLIMPLVCGAMLPLRTILSCNGKLLLTLSVIRMLSSSSTF